MIQVLLVDDEPAANRRLADLLSTFGDVRVIGAVNSITEAIAVLATQKPNLIFLDIRMPRHSGMSLIPHLSPQTRVVFVTGHENYALAAFEVGALDYLLKPVERSRLELTIERVRHFFRQPLIERSAASSPILRIPGKVMIPGLYGKPEEWVSFDEILWIDAEQNYSRLQLVGRVSLLVKRTITEWDEHLPIAEFNRLGRSLIIHSRKLRATEWQSRDKTLLFFEGLDEPLVIGRIAASRLRELIAVPGKTAWSD
jgi:two-component system LytT family response regulator